MFWFFKRKKDLPRRTIVIFRNHFWWFKQDYVQVLKIKDSELKILWEIAERSNITLLVK